MKSQIFVIVSFLAAYAFAAPQAVGATTDSTGKIKWLQCGSYSDKVVANCNMANKLSKLIEIAPVGIDATGIKFTVMSLQSQPIKSVEMWADNPAFNTSTCTIVEAVAKTAVQSTVPQQFTLKYNTQFGPAITGNLRIMFTAVAGQKPEIFSIPIGVKDAYVERVSTAQHCAATSKLGHVLNSQGLDLTYTPALVKDKTVVYYNSVNFGVYASVGFNAQKPAKPVVRSVMVRFMDLDILYFTAPSIKGDVIEVSATKSYQELLKVDPRTTKDNVIVNAADGSWVSLKYELVGLQKSLIADIQIQTQFVRDCMCEGICCQTVNTNQPLPNTIVAGDYFKLAKSKDLLFTRSVGMCFTYKDILGIKV